MKMPAYLSFAYLAAEADMAAVADPQLFIWLMQDHLKKKKKKKKALGPTTAVGWIWCLNRFGEKACSWKKLVHQHRDEYSSTEEESGRL